MNNFMKTKEVKELLKGAVVIDVTIDSWFSSIESMTVEKDGKLFLLSVEANMGYESTPEATLEITDVSTSTRIF